MIFTPELFPFTVALIILMAIALLEGLGLLFGAAMSSMLDAIIPDIDLDVDANVSSHGVLTKILGWMNVGKVPVLIILVSFLASFGISGYLLQGLMYSVMNVYLPSIIAILLALVLSIPFTRSFTSLLAKVMPKDESSAISTDTFIGKTAVIVIGKATKGSPAEAKLIDQHGQVHYMMLEPKTVGVEFNQGEIVIISKENNSGFYAIKNNNQNLID